MSTVNQLGKYQPYQQYESIAVPWYKQKPTHWLSVKFKHFFNEKRKTNNPNLPAGAISFGEVIYKDEEKLSQDTKDSYQEVLAGEFLINPLNLNFDLKSLRTALSTIDVVVSTGYIVLTMGKKLNPRFSKWLLQQFDVSHMKTLGSGVRQTINYNDIGNSLFCLPTPEEQRTIAAFLDYETAHIDQLIAKQQQLIELLKEKRQAVISHAVTKGLNPNAPMKDSGVEWLGQVPEHWVVPQIGYRCQVTKLTGFEYTNYWEPDDMGEIIALRGYNIGERTLDLEKKTEKISVQLSKLLARSKLHKDDVVMPCTGTLGNAAVIPKSDSFHINQNIAKLKFSDSINPTYATYWLTSNIFRRIIDHNNTSGMQPVLLIGDIRKMRIPVPPTSEQHEIVCYLNRKTAEFEVIINNGLKLLTLLQERRTALVSAAVTGKIDLRGWQPPKCEVAA